MDERLLLWINQDWGTPWLDPFFLWISERGSFTVPLLLLILLYLARQFGRDGVKFWIMLLLVVISGDLIGNLVKHLTAQARPCFDAFELIRQPGRAGSEPCGGNLLAMPSNHALNFFAAALFIWSILPKRLISFGLIVVAILVAISRIYLAKHYPSQVAAGFLIGSFYGWITGLLGLKYLRFLQHIKILKNAHERN
ncbi:MAG: phosphatase PAP2 family protein [Gammaproteobacteria bacterium]